IQLSTGGDLTNNPPKGWYGQLKCGYGVTDGLLVGLLYGDYLHLDGLFGTGVQLDGLALPLIELHEFRVLGGAPGDIFPGDQGVIPWLKPLERHGALLVGGPTLSLGGAFLL